jgi:hypothetical protein
MKTKKIILAALAGTALLASAGAQARDGNWDRGDHGYRGHYQSHYYYRPAPYYYGPAAPVYYAPAPVYYAPQAPVYYAPRPAIYGQIPIGHHSGISFRFPL